MMNHVDSVGLLTDQSIQENAIPLFSPSNKSKEKFHTTSISRSPMILQRVCAKVKPFARVIFNSLTCCIRPIQDVEYQPPPQLEVFSAEHEKMFADMPTIMDHNKIDSILEKEHIQTRTFSHKGQSYTLPYATHDSFKSSLALYLGDNLELEVDKRKIDKVEGQGVDLLHVLTEGTIPQEKKTDVISLKTQRTFCSVLNAVEILANSMSIEEQMLLGEKHLMMGLPKSHQLTLSKEGENFVLVSTKVCDVNGMKLDSPALATYEICERVVISPNGGKVLEHTRVMKKQVK